MIEFHGRLDYTSAFDVIRRLERFEPTWCEEPIVPESIELLAKLKHSIGAPISAGERLYAFPDFYRLITLRACDVVQMDIAHCGGIAQSKKIAALAAAQDMRISPHCSVGPVALAAALHVDISTPNFMVQETFAEFDVPWRHSFVKGWNPQRGGEFAVSAWNWTRMRWRIIRMWRNRSPVCGMAHGKRTLLKTSSQDKARWQHRMLSYSI